MKKSLLAFLLINSFLITLAQEEEQTKDTSWKHIYRASYTRINELVHTKLMVSFDYNKSWMFGKEWVTLRPHFYPTDSLTLDAKGMEIKEISLMKGTAKIPLKYEYDGMELRINLGRMYKATENYTLYIDYISKPDELKVEGSAAITDAKGLYFINPKGEDPDKPTEIWTQGETEANSAWFPTLDKPNEKTTEEIYMTVPSKYVTLSNGLLISQKKNADSTRTDYWRMDLPHSPYLFFMGVGDYVIVKDKYKNIPVDYYVEKEYASVAKKIFGETPAMIGLYEKLTGVPFPWTKYDQIVGRDYVSGAMENTTATLHQESAYQNARQLVDGNKWEEVIAHELFHQWFGDLVTTESWSNITLNESFADYSETLWDTYRYGKDAGDEHIEENRQTYLSNPANFTKDLVRFYYSNKEDVFDQVSYPKGGSILHMLRSYVGDSAFFKSLNLYLNTYKFKNAEAHQLRLVFEQVTGQDLNWFWNQWYFGSGQPDLTINYDYNNGKARVIIDQTQETGKLFKLPMAIDVYSDGANKKRYRVWAENKADTFYFPSAKKPSLINVDAEKVLVSRKTDNKSAEEYEQQYKYAGNYMDRKEALAFFAKNKTSDLANGLSDKYYGLRLFTLEAMDQNNSYSVPTVLATIEQIAEKDPNKNVQAKAIELLAKTNDKKYLPLFNKYVSDSSYSVSGAALEGITRLEPSGAYNLAKKYSSDAKGKLGTVVTKVIMENATENDFDIILNNFKNAPITQSKIQQTFAFAGYLATLKNSANVKKGVDEIMKLRNKIPEQYKKYVDPGFKQAFSKIIAAQKAQGNNELASYIAGLIE
ncbi:MAG: M1 family metallopeptidase [Bacteroidota bacterium]|nr:M1 family metallopeptidase [Bacteroidota bacterium]